MELKRKPRGDKIYRGAYNYLKGETVYCEEEFEVYKDRKELSLSFFALLHSRVLTGELLNIYVDYQVTKDFIPKKVLIEKTLGKKVSTEIYDFNSKTNKIDYLFITNDKEEHVQITTSPKFSITTPATCTSMIFLRSKKEDTTTKNSYSIISNRNNWTYKGAPYSHGLILERMALGAESIPLDGANVQAIPYKLFDAEAQAELEENEAPPFIKAYLSKHITIPYILESNDGTKIQIKYLNDLDKD